MDVVKHFHRQIFSVVRNRDKDCSGCIGVCTEPQPCSQQDFPYIWVWEIVYISSSFVCSALYLCMNVLMIVLYSYFYTFLHYILQM